jgi:peptidoglycan hydrolase-like protein with peptidoglycan-binding domain
MDLIKTLLVYMMLLVGSATQAAPAVTPPASQPAATDFSFVTMVPIAVPTAVPTLAPTMVPTMVPTRVPTAVPTLAPTATPTAYTTLYVGDRGEAVRKLQLRLAELKYLTDKIDGIYGQNTKRAVERFQYYNNLTVDGIAGKATQRMLFESRNVVTAPPDITPGPTPTQTPASVNVPVYYVDQNGQLLNRVYVACFGTTTIFANNDNVGSNYTLVSPGSVVVSVRNGVASPASVTFRYQYVDSPTAAPETVSVPVYYMTETGDMLYQTTASLPRGVTSYVTVNIALVPSVYQLTSAANVAVSVNAYGAAFPGSVIFTFRNATPTPVPETQQTQVPVRYVNENGFLLNETIVTIRYGQTMTVYASAGMVERNYRLISQNPVIVSVNASGTAVPAVVIFTYTYVAPTEAPTEEPTPVPPTEAPTEKPTEVPPTEAPTEEPTEVPPTEAPTEAPTEKPTEVPPTEAPTEEPTEVPPTEAPTEAPTEEPTEVPPTEAPTEEPTEVPPTEAPTEEPTEVPPTEAPTEEPTEVPPTEAPTEEPTPVPPTEAPTEEPTPVPPTEAPTEAPTEEPQHQFTPSGSSVDMNGESYTIQWYTDSKGTAFISLLELSEKLNWGYTRQGDCTILDRAVYVAYNDSGVQALTVNGVSQANHAMVWNGDLYVNAKFLESLGLNATVQGSTLVLKTLFL